MLKEYKDVTSESTFFPFHSQVSVTANSHFEEVWKITVFQGIRASASNWSWQTPLKPSSVNSICFTFSLLPTPHTHSSRWNINTHTLISLQTDLWWWKSERGSVIYLKGIKLQEVCRWPVDRTCWLSRTHVERTLCPPVKSLQVCREMRTDTHGHDWRWTSLLLNFIQHKTSVRVCGFKDISILGAVSRTKIVQNDSSKSQIK